MQTEVFLRATHHERKCLCHTHISCCTTLRRPKITAEPSSCALSLRGYSQRAADAVTRNTRKASRESQQATEGGYL